MHHFDVQVIILVWLNAFADLFSGFFLFIYAPTYTKKVRDHFIIQQSVSIQVLGLSSTETGIVGAIGSFSHIPVKLVCGYVSDTYQ